MNKNILILFIKSLNVNNSMFYLKYLGYDFSKDEIEKILPYLKSNTDKLDKNNKNYLMDNLPPVSPYCKKQLSKLFDQFI